MEPKRGGLIRIIGKNVWEAAMLLREDVRNQIRKAHEEIGFEYIRFHGLLDDDMSVVIAPRLPFEEPHVVNFYFLFPTSVLSLDSFMHKDFSISVFRSSAVSSVGLTYCFISPTHFSASTAVCAAASIAS